jgi:hypothetical protein
MTPITMVPGYSVNRMLPAYVSAWKVYLGTKEEFDAFVEKFMPRPVKNQERWFVPREMPYGGVALYNAIETALGKARGEVGGLYSYADESEFEGAMPMAFYSHAFSVLLAICFPLLLDEGDFSIPVHDPEEAFLLANLISQGLRGERLRHAFEHDIDATLMDEVSKAFDTFDVD